MKQWMIPAGLLIVLGAGAAVAQITGGAAPIQVGPGAGRSIQVSPDMQQRLETERLNKEVARLTTLTGSLETRLAALETKAGTTLSRLDALQYHFENHQHMLRGYLGSGISSASDGKGKVITYMTPFNSEAEQKNAAVTTPPMK